MGRFPRSILWGVRVFMCVLLVLGVGGGNSCRFDGDYCACLPDLFIPAEGGVFVADVRGVAGTSFDHGRAGPFELIEADSQVSWVIVCLVHEFLFRESR